MVKLKKNQILHRGGTEGFSSFMYMNLENQSSAVILTNRAMKPVHKLGISLIKEMDQKIT